MTYALAVSAPWDSEKITYLFELPFADLIFAAQSIHRQHFPANEIELCTLLSIKTAGCPEDCTYCSQSAHYQTQVVREKLMDIEQVLENAKQAKANGSKRFCMGAAWRNPPKKDFPKVLELVKAVKDMGLETCVTLGMLDQEQAQELKKAGLDFYNHNLDTSPEFYNQIVTTRTYQDRLDTINHVANAGINVCCGGILGLGEARQDRVNFLLALTKLPVPPKSIPINQLMPMPGTPLANTPPLDPFEFVRTIAIARILVPNALVRLSAGRANMSQELQSLCFLAGANSIWLGEKLLTAKNAEQNEDQHLLAKLGIKPHLRTEQHAIHPD